MTNGHHFISTSHCNKNTYLLNQISASAAKTHLDHDPNRECPRAWHGLDWSFGLDCPSCSSFLALPWD
ncbi:hypothetical protein FVER53590_25964 [Fusarium verticillioides]|nr:hypothetical protein FVER53590_25964 [Fusarium verticillioides]